MKKWGHFCRFRFSFLRYDPQIVEKNAKKSKYVKAICIHASGRSCYELSENIIVYYAMT